jgi:hypothetical protein
VTRSGVVQRFGALLLAATVVSFALAAAAQGNFIATATDPAGDSADPSAGRDIIAASMSYDRRSGELIGAVQLRGVPGEERSFLSLFAGTRTATGCDGLPYVGFGSYSDEFGASWKRLDDPAGTGPSGDAEKVAYRDAVQRFEATDGELAGHRLDCVMATVTEPGNPANVYDAAGPFELVGQPALSMRVRGVGRPFKPNRPRKLKVTLANAGDAATSPVRLRLSRARGLRVTPAKKSLGTLAPGSKRTVSVEVTLSGRARDATRLKVTASAGGLVARGKPTLYLRKPSKPGGGGGGDTQWCTRWVPDITGATGGSLIHVPC